MAAQAEPPARKPFLFELDFAQPSSGQEPPRRPEPTPEPQEAEAPEIDPTLLAAARDEGYAAGQAAGLEAGRAEGREAAEAEAAERAAAAEKKALEALATALQDALARQETELRQRQEEAVTMAMTVIERLLPKLAKKSAAAEILDLVRGCLATLEREPRVVVRLAEAALTPLSAKLQKLAQSVGYEGKLVLLGEPGLALDEVRVEWADGGAERQRGEALQQIDKLIAKHLGGAAASARKAPSAPRKEGKTS